MNRTNVYIDGFNKTEEKGSDVALATYLILDACRGDCETAVLITNDSDLREPLRVARARWFQVRKRPSFRLLNGAEPVPGVVDGP
jgi:NYN domain